MGFPEEVYPAPNEDVSYIGLTTTLRRVPGISHYHRVVGGRVEDFTPDEVPAQSS